MVARRRTLKPGDIDATMAMTASMVISSKKDSKKKISWGEIIVFEFPNMLGDNPAVSGGSPITIGWKHDSIDVFTVEYREYAKLKKPRRKRKDLVLSSAQRDKYLLGLGYSIQQLLEAAEEVQRVQKSRQAQIKSLKTWNKFKQVFEGATRSLGFGNPQEPKILAAKCG